jgi:uncharacterized membrane protein
MFLPLIIALIMLPILPNNIPMHYNSQNEIDRWGSKYESLILPLIIIGIGFFLRAMGKLSSKNETNENNSNEKASITMGIATLLLFNFMTYIFLYTGYMQSVVDVEYKLDFNRAIFSIMGIVLIIIGNIMPKCKMNSIIGLRTTWSMKNERTWFLSQRFGGLVFIIAGLVIILGNILKV